MSRLSAMRAFLSAACLAVALSTATALYSAGSKVVQLTEKDFKQVVKGDELWLVEFYAPYVPVWPPVWVAGGTGGAVCVHMTTGGVATARAWRPSTPRPPRP